MDTRTRIIGAILLAGLASACTDEAPPTSPEAATQPGFGVVAVTDLFFYGPPVGQDESQPADFDPTYLTVSTFEICLESDLDGTDPLADRCLDPLGRWTSDGGPTGISGEIFLVRGEENDWYQVDIPFDEFGGGTLEVDGETTYVGRVVVGDPEQDVIEAYGAFTFVLVRDRRGGPAGSGADLRVNSDRSLPVKWFVGVGASEQLLCDTEACTTKVIVADDGGELCFPEEDCGSPEATAGVSIEGGVLPDDIILKIEDIDLAEDPNPLGIQNSTIEEAVDISTTPRFEDLDAFDNDGDGVADIAIQLCYSTPDPDAYATYRSTAEGAERLPFDPRGNFLFDDANCGGGTPPVASLLGDGVLGKAALALQTRVLRPAWRLVGPQPLRAGDKSFTADTRGFSVFAPAIPLDLVANESPSTVPAGSTVPISVCVEGLHPGSPVQPAPGVEVFFETDDGSLSATSATAQLEPAANANCDTTPDQNGDVAVARVDWTAPNVPNGTVLSARAFLPGDYLVSADDDLDGDQDNTPADDVFELEAEILEVGFQATVGSALIACGPYPPASGGGDRFDLRGFYVPSYPGTTLDRVELFLSGDAAGSYEVSLTAVDGDFASGTVLATASTTVVLDGTSDQNAATAFDFGGIATTVGDVVSFIPEVVSSPGTTFFNVPTEDPGAGGLGFAGDAECPQVIETNGTTSPIGSDDRRQGVGIRVFGAEPVVN